MLDHNRIVREHIEVRFPMVCPNCERAWPEFSGVAGVSEDKTRRQVLAGLGQGDT
jgi:hypothetical protein